MLHVGSIQSYTEEDIWHFELTTDCVTLLAGLLWPKPFRCSLQSGPFERKQHIYAMDYRHVAKNFRRCALLVQLSLLSSLAAYAAYRALRIMQSGDTPAADISVKHWHGYSAWAVCCIPGYDPTRYCNGVRAAGVGFFESFDGLRVAWTPNGTGLTANSHKLASSVISQRTISFAGYALTCSVWDLTEVPEMMIPGTFSLCARPFTHRG